MSRHCSRHLLHAGMIFSALLAPGCSKPQQQPADKAEKILEQFLDAWSQGRSPDAFAESDGPIQGSDPDWKAGHRLLSFLSAEVKASQDAPDVVRCRVSLSLQDKKGRKWDKDVVYDVELAEKCVVRRVSP